MNRISAKFCLILMLSLPFHIGHVGYGISYASVNASLRPMQDDKRAETERNGNTLLKSARKKYKEGAYWKSAIDLIVVLDFYSEYSRMDETLYLLGTCLYDMGMFEATNHVFRYLIQTIPKTPLLPNAMLGMQKVYYQQKTHDLSLKFYKALEAHYTTFGDIDESRYYAAQSYFHLENYTLVPNIVSHIGKNSDFYPFGQYTSGLANLKKKLLRKSIENFIEVANYPASTAARLDIANSARLTLGYIFFELSNYKTGVQYLIDIPPEFYDYPDALLAIGWAAFKLQDHETALLALTSLVQDYDDFYNMEEAYFVLGQCHLTMGNYDAAIGAYDMIIQKSPRTDNFSELIKETRSALVAQEQHVEGLKTELLILESRLLSELPISANGNGASDYVEDEQQRIRQYRESLVELIYEEKREFEVVSNTIDAIRKRIEKAERQKDWRSYAEYGRGRALYLKGIAGDVR